MFFSDSYGNLYVHNTDGSGAPEILFEFGVDNIIPLGVSYLPEDNSLYIISNYLGVVTPGIFRGSVDGNELEELFTDTDNLVNPYDVKVDVGAQKLFVLDELRTIRVGSHDGSGSLSTLITRDNDILGISLDMTEDFVYWLEFVNSGKTKASVFRMKYDGSTIPGTDPPATIEEVYTNINETEFDPNDPFTSGVLAGLVVENEGGEGSAMRGMSSFTGIKMKALSKSFKLNFKKKARPGE
jgi:hypothetical protein